MFQSLLSFQAPLEHCSACSFISPSSKQNLFGQGTRILWSYTKVHLLKRIYTHVKLTEWQKKMKHSKTFSRRYKRQRSSRNSTDNNTLRNDVEEIYIFETIISRKKLEQCAAEYDSPPSEKTIGANRAWDWKFDWGLGFWSEKTAGF